MKRIRKVIGRREDLKTRLKINCPPSPDTTHEKLMMAKRCQTRCSLTRANLMLTDTNERKNVVEIVQPDTKRLLVLGCRIIITVMMMMIIIMMFLLFFLLYVLRSLLLQSLHLMS